MSLPLLCSYPNTPINKISSLIAPSSRTLYLVRDLFRTPRASSSSSRHTKHHRTVSSSTIQVKERPATKQRAQDGSVKMEEARMAEQGERDENDLARRFRHDVYGQSRDHHLSLPSCFVDGHRRSRKLTSTVSIPFPIPPPTLVLARKTIIAHRSSPFRPSSLTSSPTQ